jgi:Tol biopolymer transport system component
MGAVSLMLAVLLGWPDSGTVGGASVTSAHQHTTSPAMRNGPITLITRSHGIWSIDSTGSAHQIFPCPRCAHLMSFAWAPDGKRLVFDVTTVTMANSYNGIHVITPSRGADHHLCRRGVRFCPEGLSFDWSPDGKRIAYVVGAWPTEVGDIYVMNPDGTHRGLLRTGTGGHDSSPSWSPDGRRLAFATTVGDHLSVSTINRDGSDRRLVFHAVLPRGSAWPNSSLWPDWSPDGTKIALKWGCGIKLISPQGRDVTPQSPKASGRCVGVPGLPVWSPDGHKIAMAVRTTGIYVMDADGSHLEQISTAGIPRDADGLAEDGRGLFGYARPSWQPLPSRRSAPHLKRRNFGGTAHKR